MNKKTEQSRVNPIAAKFEKWQKASALSAWVILHNGVHVATIQRKGMDKEIAEVILITFEDMRRTFHYGKAKGHGYDRTSSALERLKIEDFTFKDEGCMWDAQLMNAGYEIIAVVW